LKKAAKFFANKFATGSSVSKNPQGEDEIFIQGDVADEVEDMILDDEDKKAIAVFGGKVAGSQIEVVDEGKLKKKNA
jgi:density-regulated protein DRP1